MSRLIDADALKRELKVKRDYLDTSTAVGRGIYIALNKAITILDEQPTVDAVQVVRCGECKYRDTEIMYCGMVDLIRKNDDWYCADGERREE